MQERSPEAQRANHQMLMRKNDLAMQIKQLAEMGKQRILDFKNGTSSNNLHSKQRLLSPTASQQQAYQHGSNLASGSIKDLSTINSNNSPPRMNEAVWNAP